MNSNREGATQNAAHWPIVVVATLAMSVSYIDRQVFAVVAESVQSALHYNDEHFGWLNSGFAFAYLIGAPLAGLMVDRLGAKKSLLFAVLVWSVVAASHALASSFAMLMVLRIALGLAESPSFPGAAQAVKRALPPARRSAGFGILFTGSSIGVLVATPLAVSLRERFGWPGAFFVTAAIGLLWIPAWLIVTRRSAALARVPENQEPAPVESARAETARAEPAISRWRLLRSGAVLRAILLTFGSGPAIMFVFGWYPKFLQRQLHVDELSLRRYLWLPPILFDVGALGFGFLASRRDVLRKRIDSHADLVAAGMLLTMLLALVPYTQNPWVAVILASLSLAGGGCLYGRFTADMIARVPASYVSVAAGITAAAQSISHIVANPIIGRAIDRTHSYDAPHIWLGLWIVPCALGWIFWPKRSLAVPVSR